MTAKPERATTEAVSTANQANSPGKALCHARRVALLAPGVVSFAGCSRSACAHCPGLQFLASYLASASSSPGWTESPGATFTRSLFPPTPHSSLCTVFSYTHLLISSPLEEPFKFCDVLIYPRLSWVEWL